MQSKKIFAIVVVLGLFSLSAYHLFLKKHTINTHDTLTIGIAAHYAPFVSINPYNEYEGFDIDIAHAIGEKLGKKIIFKDMGSMVPLFIALQQGSVDMLLWGISITQERLKNVAMVHYSGDNITNYTLLFWKEKPPHINTLHDMQGMTVCVEPHSSQQAVLNAYPHITQMETEKIDDALLHIQYKKADAALVENAIATKFKRHYSNDIVAIPIPIAIELQEAGVGIAIKKNNTTLLAQIEKAIRELKENGTIAQYEKKWFTL